jgi:cation diffusion facilitator family transporter
MFSGIEQTYYYRGMIALSPQTPHIDANSLNEAVKTSKRKAARQVFILTLGFNLLVSLGKLVWGYQSHTLSLTADGFHSLLDAVANVVGIIALNYSLKPADQDHPYGHRKFEAIASMIISFFIFMTCFEIAGQGVGRILNPGSEPPQITVISYLVIGVTLSINLLVAWYERKKGKELGNDLLLADAKHTLSDCLVSFSVILSMVAIQAGFAWADTALAFIVAIIILKVGFELIMLHLSALTDEVILDPRQVEALVREVPGVLDCHKIRSRGMSDHIFIDLHIQVDPSLTVKEAHQISYAVEEHLEKAYEGKVSEVLVHIEEYEGA